MIQPLEPLEDAFPVAGGIQFSKDIGAGVVIALVEAPHLHMHDFLVLNPSTFGHLFFHMRWKLAPYL